MARNLVTREDGKLVNVARKRGQLFVCSTGCCCGQTEGGHAPVPVDLYHQEWERRRLRNRVHLTQAGCLGPCPLANVALLLFDDRHIWFHSINDEARVGALYDYVESMLEADAYLPPPQQLASYHFTSYAWDGPESEHARPARSERAAVERRGFLVLSQADTDLLAFAAARGLLPEEFPPVRAFNPDQLKTDADIDAFLDAELPRAEVVVVRLLGGRGSFARGIERIAQEAAGDDFWLVCLPGTDSLDPELTAVSNAGVPVAHEFGAYLQSGGVANYEQGLRFLSDHLLTTAFGYERPAPQPRHGIYHPDLGLPSREEWLAHADPALPTLGLLFYRSHLLAGNTAFVDAIIRSGEAAGCNVKAVYAYSLKEPGEAGVPAPLAYFMDGGRTSVDALICTMSFALGGVDPESAALSDWSAEVLKQLDVPVLQAVTVSSTHAQWSASLRGLSPLDTAMNVAVPEFDGRIISVPVSFKAPVEGSGGAGVRYAPDEERVERLVAQALRLVALRRKPNAEKRIVFMLTNQAARASRIGNAVGLDAPASLVLLMRRMQQEGYRIEGVPESGDALIHALIERCSYDLEVLTDAQLAGAAARVPVEEYGHWFKDLAEKSRGEMQGRWGPPPGAAYVHNNALALAGLQFGNAFVALQPPRGYGMDPNAIYHLPDLPPPHNYHALYRWLREPGGFGADAIVHVGKHGTLEWLPGKAVGPGPECYPDQFLAEVPLIYPFIVNDPGEGTQAKRRAHAVVVDHMTPPMTTAGAYGDLAELAQLIDEYYQVELMDPEKLPLLQQQIWEVLQRANLGSDLELLLNRNSSGHTHTWDPALTEEGTPVSLTEMRGKDFAHLLQEIDGYLCELAGAQIRDGLHILGAVPEPEALAELLFHLVRLPGLEAPSLPDAVASAAGLAPESLSGDLGRRLEGPAPACLQRGARGPIGTYGELAEAVEGLSKALLGALAEGEYEATAIADLLERVFDRPAPQLEGCLRFVCEQLVPRLKRIPDETENLLRALDGRYIEPGPSGAPTRGMAHVLPTGRNFYGVDPRAIPSMAAWSTGTALADALLQKHLREEGSYPESVGISMWGTSAMRTHGDDIAEVFALLGVRPRWQPENRRLLGVDLVSLEELGRPRIDVVCRISGFFRDAFPHLIHALDEAVNLVAGLDEPPEQNFVRRRALAEQQRLAESGVDVQEAQRRSRLRVFGCKPGTYGAGILPLIDERNWQGAADFAEVYVNWGGYAYTAERFGEDARDDFKAALSHVEVAVKNQDNREHDIFDSDDYLQFHGGMIAAIRAVSGRSPRKYFGDSADPRRAQVRDLKEESLRVFRSRVVNPKWLESIRRHGYKGGLEMAATVDYIFGYDATAEVIEGWMYAQVAEKYALDGAASEFLKQSNPWALRDIAGRLLEAAQRGMWDEPDPETLERLRQIYLEAEAELEGAMK